MKLANLTWADIDQLDRTTVVVIPFGAMEQHGPHLPMQTDALIGEELTRRLDDACGGRLLVLPMQWLGLSLHHMRFSGTLTASVDTYLALVFDIVSSIALAGFCKILVLNSHGGNSASLDVALVKCRSQYPDLRILHVTYWKLAADSLSQLRESKTGGMGHACELETSLVMAASPGLVRADKIKPDGRWPVPPFLGKDMLDPGRVTMARSFHEISKSGPVGDPRSASAEKGQRFFAAIVGELVRVIESIESGAIDEFRDVGD
jgi:creatinine amidohydrolase